MIASAPNTIENLRNLRSVIELYEAANSAVCAAQTAGRSNGITAAGDAAEIIQAELRAASKIFRSSYSAASDALDDDAAEYLHKAVWS